MKGWSRDAETSFDAMISAIYNLELIDDKCLNLMFDISGNMRDLNYNLMLLKRHRSENRN